MQNGERNKKLFDSPHIATSAASAHASSCKSADDDEMKLVRYQVLNPFIELMGHKRVYFPLATVRDNDLL